MADILFVTWDGGGNVPPALGIARELRARGHTTRFLGHAAQLDALAEAGVEPVRPRHAREFDNRRDYAPLTMMATFGDRGMGRDLVAAVAARPADLVVVDGLMFGAMRAAVETGLRFVVLEHMYDAAYRRGILGGPMGLSLRLRRLAPQRSLDAAAARLLATVPTLDPLPAPPANLVRIGPVVAVAERREPARPSVLVSLSTFGFPRMRQSLQAVLDATRGLGADVVATTGPAVDPAELELPPGVEVHRFVPHVELMPRTTLLVGHGGHGTTMQALAHDLPVVVMPMERLTDQPAVGRTLEEAGAGRMVRKGATAEQLAPVLAELLGDGPHRAAAARLGAEVRSLPGATLGADAVEELLRDGAAARGRRAAPR
jgi:UDP:flavonoid glycosyltransferase YjiC (YdhE family)